MKPCQSAGHPCPHEATVTVRVDHVGDRAMCQVCAEFVVAQGFGRVLDTNAFVPLWRENLRAVDLTGRVLA